MRRGKTCKRPTIGAAFVVTICLLLPLGVPADAHARAARPKQVRIAYVPPTNPAQMPLYKVLKEKRILEKLQYFLSPIRLPRKLLLKLEGCDGVANAWYLDRAVTVCYELLQEVWEHANSPTRPAYVAREDAVIGPFVDTVLHEVSHAVFDMLDIPVLGREEDAADLMATFITLQFPKEQARRLIMGSAYGYARELKLEDAGELSRGKKLHMEMQSFADVHGTPAQRMYNVFCVAYGADPKLFADIVEKGFLPAARADVCEEEYRQVAHAYRRLIRPHIDRRLARKVLAKRWLPEPRRPSPPRPPPPRSVPSQRQ